MKTRIYIILLSGFLLQFYSCGKEKVFTVRNIRLEIPVSIKPIKETYQIGESIDLEINISDSIKDYETGEKLKVKDLVYNTELLIVKIGDPNRYFSEQTWAVDRFDFKNETGGLINPKSASIELQMDYQNNSYRISSKIIPKAKGIYAFELLYFPPPFNGETGSVIKSVDLGNDSNGNKIIVTMDNIRYLINDGDTNFETLFRKYSKVVLTDPVEIELLKRFYFTFEVK